MNDVNKPGAAELPIAAVERDTGLSKDTLRVWERRYGFPLPVRDANGERAYPAAQVEQLRLISRLLNHGHRPGRVVPLPLAELHKLAQDAGAGAPADSALEKEIGVCLGLLKSQQVLNLRHLLHQTALRMGLARFVIELLSPLTVRIGEAWVRGEIQVYEEHLYTESVVAVLRSAISGIPAAPPPARPRVLMTTLPNEQHGMGLLMAEALLALEGCDCLSLGVQTPVTEIAQAARANQVQIVALSFSANFPAPQLTRGLQDLRAELPPDIQIWAGGSHPSLRRFDVPGITPVPRLDSISPLLAQWRAAQAAAATATRQ